MVGYVQFCPKNVSFFFALQINEIRLNCIKKTVLPVFGICNLTINLHFNYNYVQIFLRQKKAIFFGPQEIWCPRNLGLKKFGPWEIWAPHENHHMAFLCGAQTSRRPNFLGTKSQGPKWYWGPFQLQPEKVIIFFGQYFAQWTTLHCTRSINGMS